MHFSSMFKRTVLAALLGFGAASLAAGVRMQTVEAVGSGATRTEAINAALTEAVSKVNGLSISAKDQSAIAAASETRAEDDVSHTKSATLEAASREVQTATAGYVRQYQILSISTDPKTQTVEAKLSVDVNTFDGGKATNRMRIAVLPFKIEGAQKVTPEQQKQFLLNANQAAVSYLTSTRHFAVLDRDFAGERMNELRSLLSPDVRPEERARLGNTLATDYILTGRVLEFEAQSRLEKVPYTGETVKATTGQVSVQWRLIEAATGQIAVAGTLTLPIRNEKAVTANGAGIGRDIAAQITETIYPIAAVGYENGQILIAQGGETMRAGDMYTLVRQGAIRKDPYTGEQMGRSEMPVGDVRITRVTPKMAYGQVLNCRVDLKGMAPREYLLRRAEGGAGTSAAPGSSAPAQPAW